ncbi:DUF6894 family protein [Methylobacterium brachiatum]|jgi:hypothetical protein|uniref:DUF6894 family protein n=1 Tax=Methylobacterium brachiatum TaxID=269660 RepID=UPI000EFB2054|nr:hypothetical protein [Methylobacterium brachiatum]AYO85902.1 hypothetical protein EBB05_04355 [Methylobacterium brachiatum]
MARYFFDVIDGRTISDEVGLDLADLAALRREAMRLLPEIARHEMHNDDRDVQTLAIVVRDEAGQPIYTANLSYAGIWLRS